MLIPDAAVFQATNGADFLQFNGTSCPITFLAYDGSFIEEAFWKLSAKLYGAGASGVTADLEWGAATALAGDVVWEVALMAYTPNTDMGSILAESFGTPVAATTAKLGTSAQQIQLTTIALSGAALDALAQGDVAFVRVRRLATDAGDTMSGDAYLERVEVTYAAS